MIRAGEKLVLRRERTDRLGSVTVTEVLLPILPSHLSEEMGAPPIEILSIPPAEGTIASEIRVFRNAI
jgi:hypothetical protein